MRLRCVIRPSEGEIVPESVRVQRGVLSYEVAIPIPTVDAANGNGHVIQAAPFTLGPLRVLPERCQVETPDGTLMLNRGEMIALVLLGSEPGTTITKQGIKTASGWPPQVATRSCDSQVSRLRCKLRPYGVEIVNVWGYGWYLTAPDGTKVAS